MSQGRHRSRTEPSSRYTLSKKGKYKSNKESPTKLDPSSLSILDILQDKSLYIAFEVFLKSRVAVVENLLCLREIHDYRLHHPTNSIKKACSIIETYFFPEPLVSIDKDNEIVKELLVSKENFVSVAPFQLFDKSWMELVQCLQEYVTEFANSDQWLTKKNKRIKLKVKKSTLTRNKKYTK